uniref:Secreted protein n=1 Tax=Lutzomyia longipalpis TaxID=7200 RepID=A0A7G3B7Q7_LUTLO
MKTLYVCYVALSLSLWFHSCSQLHWSNIACNSIQHSICDPCMFHRSQALEKDSAYASLGLLSKSTIGLWIRFSLFSIKWIKFLPVWQELMLMLLLRMMGCVWYLSSSM